jgi:hypothetical protein
LLLHDQDVYDRHCWSEGNHHWLYAGLCTGNYALTYGGLRLWEYPYLPHFDLLKMHPLSVDVGMPWTAQFFSGKPDWQKPENIVSSIDQFLAATIAYGHIGWLVEEAHGIRQTCRSYYMLQPLQKRYAMRKPKEIRYGTQGGLVDSSEAFRSGQWRMSRLFIHYPNDLRIWVNGHSTETWHVDDGNRTHELPPFGWLAQSPDGFYECSESRDGRRYDHVSAPDLVFLDGRGHWRDLDGIGTSGSVAVQRSRKGQGLSLITVEGVDRLTVRTPSRTFDASDVRTAIKNAAQSKAVEVRAFDENAEDLGQVATEPNEAGWQIHPPQSTVRLDVKY